MAIIKVKIDVMKIDKSKLFIGKNGAKYLDCTLLENKNGADQYGNNFMVVQDVSKEEREQGVKGTILGNAKYAGQGPSKPAAKTPSSFDDVPGGESDSVPF